MKRIIKDNTQILIGFIIGAIVFTGLSSLVAYAIGANEVSFTPTDTNWKVNDTTVGDVKTALDSLYNKSENTLASFKDLLSISMCPDCVYLFGNYAIGGELSNKDYVNDWHELNKTVFMGVKLNNDIIEETSICFIINNSPICIKTGSDNYNNNHKIISSLYNYGVFSICDDSKCTNEACNPRRCLNDTYDIFYYTGGRVSVFSQASYCDSTDTEGSSFWCS